MKCRLKKKPAPAPELPTRLREIADIPLAGARLPNAAPPTWKYMPFGAHKGSLITDLPSDYLLWCIENLENIGNGLYETLEVELWGRKDLR